MNFSRDSLFGKWCVEPNGSRFVSVRLPTGDIEKFKIKVVPECTPIAPEPNVQVAFDAVDGTISKLQQLRHNAVKLVNGHLIDPGENSKLDPDTYLLTIKDGVKYKWLNLTLSLVM